MNRQAARTRLAAQFWRLMDTSCDALDRLGSPMTVRGAKESEPATPNTTTVDLVHRHFRAHSSVDHPNLKSMRDTLALLDGRPSRIIETGMASRGTNSTLLFSDYVDTFGGELWSVDVQAELVAKLRPAVGRSTVLTCGDSVRFLRRWVRARWPDCTVDLVYLDSLDLDVEDPYPAALHGIREFFAIKPALRPGSLILVDDTPATPADCPPGMREAAERFMAAEGVMPGKGMLIDRYLQGGSASKIHHGYQVLYRFDEHRAGSPGNVVGKPRPI